MHGKTWAVPLVDERDKGTPDEWIQRHPDLVRLTGECRTEAASARCRSSLYCLICLFLPVMVRRAHCAHLQLGGSTALFAAAASRTLKLIVFRCCHARLPDFCLL